MNKLIEELKAWISLRSELPKHLRLELNEIIHRAKSTPIPQATIEELWELKKDCLLHKCFAGATKLEGIITRAKQSSGAAQVVKYRMDKPCPHCGGSPYIANPTGKCSHIHYPEDVNKSIRYPYYRIDI